MEKKRSVGVTVFGWTIALAIPVLNIIIFYLFVFNRVYKLLSYLILTIMLGICIHILLGIGILRLNNLARRIVVGMGWYLAVSVPILIIIIHAIIYKTSGIISHPLTSWELSIFIPGWIFWIASIYFFTRPKVKEQFK